MSICNDCELEFPEFGLKDYRCIGCRALMEWTSRKSWDPTSIDFSNLAEICGIDTKNDIWPYGPNVDAHARIHNYRQR